MRVLYLTGTSSRHVAPPQLGDTQIVAGPDWPDSQTIEGEWISLRTPVGEYDLGELLSKIPADQTPDVVFLSVDAHWRNRPRNVTAFPGKRILMHSSTEASERVMGELFPYLGSERFDRVMLVQSQSHLKQFLAEMAAEFRTDRHDLNWLPIRQSALARAI